MISVLIKSAEKFGLDPQELRKIVKESGMQMDGFEVSLAFVEPKTIRELNQKYRGVNKPTSVLSFFQGQDIPERGLILGDIIICPRIAERQNLEISFLVKHGLKSLLSEVSTAKDFRVRSGRC